MHAMLRFAVLMLILWMTVLSGAFTGETPGS